MLSICSDTKYVMSYDSSVSRADVDQVLVDAVGPRRPQGLHDVGDLCVGGRYEGQADPSEGRSHKRKANGRKDNGGAAGDPCQNQSCIRHRLATRVLLELFGKVLAVGASRVLLDLSKMRVFGFRKPDLLILYLRFVVFTLSTISRHSIIISGV